MLIDPYHWQTVRITDIIHESPDAVTLVTERPANYTFAPGQHAIMRATMSDGTQRLRQYSFAQNPEAQSLYFTITRSLGGDVSNWAIDQASTKSSIDISQAFTGPLCQDTTTYASVGMIGGGSGIVPLMSHLRTMRHRASIQNIHLLYTTRSSSRCYSDELQSDRSSEHIDIRLTDIDKRFTPEEIVAAIQDCEIVLVCGSREFVTNIQAIIHTSSPTLPVYGEAFSLQ